MREFYFNSYRLEMGGAARFLVRLISYITYGMLAASVMVLTFAELRWMQSLGVFLILFLADRLIHINKAEKKFTYLPKEGRVNLKDYLTPSAMIVLEKASEKAVFIGGDLRLWLMKECLERPGLKNKIMSKEIDKQLKNDCQRHSKKEVLSLLEPLIKSAAIIALDKKKKSIDAKELFLAIEGGRLDDAGL